MAKPKRPPQKRETRSFPEPRLSASGKPLKKPVKAKKPKMDPILKELKEALLPEGEVEVDTSWEVMAKGGVVKPQQIRFSSSTPVGNRMEELRLRILDLEKRVSDLERKP